MLRIARNLALGALAVSSLLSWPAPGLASSHREAPGIATNPVADNTDVYFYVSPTNPNNVVIVGDFWPFEEAAGGPNYYHFGEKYDYNFHVDNDGDAKEDIRYVFRFTRHILDPETSLYATGPITSLNDPHWNYRQTYDIIRIDKGRPPRTIASNLIVPPVNIGPRTTPNYEALASAAVATLDDGTQVFAGQRDDPFFVDLGAVFDLLGFRDIPGNTGGGEDGLGGYNCQAIVMEIPISLLTRDGSNPTNPGDAAAVLGLWSTTSDKNGAPALASQLVSVSRLGMPLVNEVVIPIGEKDKWNASRPDGDAQFLSYVTNPELPRLIQSLYNIPAPPTPRCDLVTIFLTGIPGLNQPPNVVPAEELRLNVAIKPDDQPNSRFGLLGGDLDGFPNGRRLTDDVVDIEERAVEGVAYPLLCDSSYVPDPLAGQLGDGIDQNDQPFLDHFPYLATPNQGYDHTHHRTEPVHPPQMQHAGLTKSGLHLSSDDGVVAKLARFEMHPSAPNPTRGASQIGFSLARASEVQLKVFDVSGREVRTLVSGRLEAGPHAAQWDGRDGSGNRVSAGVYLYRLASDGQTLDRKIAVIR